jgi:Family of unknown function (DUF5681)
VKLKLAICARAGNRAGLFHDQSSNPLRRFRAAGGAAQGSTSAVKFKTKEKPMTFQSGQSGNPAGRPKGARGRATILAEGLFEGEAQDIIRAAIDLAKSGDVSAIRVCLDRIAPRRRDRAIAFDLAPLHTAADAAAALSAITAAVSAGDLTPSEAADLVKLVDGFTRTLEATAFEERVARLERAVGIPATNSGQGAQASQSPPGCAHDHGAAP